MHNYNFPFESCSLKMHGLAPGLQRLAGAVQPQVPVNAMNMEEHWSLSQVRAGKQTNKPLIFFQSHPSRKYSILNRQVSYFLSSSQELSIFIPQFLEGFGKSGFDPLIGFYPPILLDSLRRQIGPFLVYVIPTFSTLLPRLGSFLHLPMKCDHLVKPPVTLAPPNFP